MRSQVQSRRAHLPLGRVAFIALLTGALMIAAAAPASAQQPLAEIGSSGEATGTTQGSGDRVAFTPLDRGSHPVLEAGSTVAWETPAIGGAIVGIALSYVGYPYVAAGNSPAGFDCSGFTQFVILVALGIDIGHGVASQPFMAGYPVAWGAWLPGDLVYFQNTYMEGVSHVAIYIGDGLIVHAENEGSGVTIDSVYSEYYAGHYWGAMRIG